MRKLHFLPLLLSVLILLSACNAKYTNDSAALSEPSRNSGGSGSSSSSGYLQAANSDSKGEYEMYDYDYGEATMSESAAPPVEEESVAQQGQFVPDVERKLIRTGYYEMETLEFDATAAAIEALVSAVGGYIESSSVNGNGAYDRSYYSYRYAEYIIRIPAAEFFNFQTELEKCGGGVLRSSQNVQEVTDYYYDIDARLKSLRIQEERLNTLISQATTLEAIIALESSLADVRYNIESNEGVIRRLDSQISFSTVSIDLQEVSRPTDPVPVTLGQRIKQRFNDSVYGFKEGGKDFLVWFLGGILEILFFVAVVVVIIIVIRKIIKRLKKKRNPPPPENGKKPDDKA